MRNINIQGQFHLFLLFRVFFISRITRFVLYNRLLTSFGSAIKIIEKYKHLRVYTIFGNACNFDLVITCNTLSFHHADLLTRLFKNHFIDCYFPIGTTLKINALTQNKIHL